MILPPNLPRKDSGIFNIISWIFMIMGIISMILSLKTDDDKKIPFV